MIGSNKTPDPQSMETQKTEGSQMTNSSNISRGLLYFLALSVVLTSILAGFFYFQNQQLKARLAEQAENQGSSPSPEPKATHVPIADWETYINDTYSFKYIDPSPDAPDFGYYKNNITDKIQEIGGGGHIFFVVEKLDTSYEDPEIYWQNQTEETYTGLSKNDLTFTVQQGIDFWSDESKENAFSTKKVVKIEVRPGVEAIGKTFRTYIVPHNEELYKLILDYGSYADQILSTFEFVDTSEAIAEEDEFRETSEASPSATPTTPLLPSTEE